MYAFAQRSDTRVVDEPLYAHYLSKTPARTYHPGAEEIIASQECDGDLVFRNQILGVSEPSVLFVKHMTHHFIALDWAYLDRVTNVILTRDPVEMLPSYAKAVENPVLGDTGYAGSVRMLDYLLAQGKKPVVLDGREILRNPKAMLSQLCEHVNIPFEPAMLRWEAGERPEDGVWARYWYDSVHRSTGFMPYKVKTEPFPEKLRPLLNECQPYYEKLSSYAIRAD